MDIISVVLTNIHWASHTSPCLDSNISQVNNLRTRSASCFLTLTSVDLEYIMMWDSFSGYNQIQPHCWAFECRPVTLPGEFTSNTSVLLCVNRQNEGFTLVTPPFYPLSCSLPALILIPNYTLSPALPNLSHPVLPIPFLISNTEGNIRGFLDHPSDHFCMEFCRISSYKKLTCQLRY